MTVAIGVLLAAAAQWFGGWWMLAVVAFGWGVVARSIRTPATRLALGVLLVGLIRLGWAGFQGAPVGEVGRLLAELIRLPLLAVWALSLALPAVVALCAATLGAAAGKRVLFG